MAWTMPRTWTTGEIITAAALNQHVRDNLNHLYAKPAFRCEVSSAQSIANGGGFTQIAFGTTAYDLSGPTKFSTTEFRTAQAGLWSFSFGVDVPAGGFYAPFTLGIYSLTFGQWMAFSGGWCSSGFGRSAMSMQMSWDCGVAHRVAFYVSNNTSGAISVGPAVASFCAGHLVSRNP